MHAVRLDVHAVDVVLVVTSSAILAKVQLTLTKAPATTVEGC